MRKSSYFVAALLAIGLLAGCMERPAEAPAVDVAAEAEVIKARSAEWYELYMARDAAGIANGIFTADAATMFDGRVNHGREAIQAHMESEFAAMPDATGSWETTKVQVAASGDLAYEMGTWSFDPDGAGEAAAMNGEYLTVWTKADGTWRAAADAGSSIKPAAAE